MSTDLAVYNPPEIDVMDRLDTATIDELTEAFHTELAHAEQGLKRSMGHLLRCGEVLHEVRSRIPYGEWKKWCVANEVNYLWSSQLIRLHVYRDSIDMTSRIDERGRVLSPSMWSAIKSISDKPSVPRVRESAPQNPQELKAVAAKMKIDGASTAEISSFLNVSSVTVLDWLNPEACRRRKAKYGQRLKEETAAKAALKAANRRAERDALAKANGKELSVAYAAVRQALAALGRADRTACPEAFKKADRYLGAAESAIVQALRAERQDH